MKILKLDQPGNESDRKLIINESAIMLDLNCDQLVKCCNIYEWNNKFHIFIEFMDGGDLKKLVEQNCLEQNEDFCKWSLYQVGLGLKAMHDRDILHRDIKADNVLYSLNGDIKICDLGFATFLSELNDYKASFRGTPCFMAPEVYFGAFYSKEVDVWSFGCLAYELATGKPPFYDRFMAEDMFGRKYQNLDSLIQSL